MLNVTDQLFGVFDEASHEADPGKDLFALLFLGFFLVSVMLMLVGQTVEKPVPVNSSAPKTVTTEPPVPAWLEKTEAGIMITQQAHDWLVTGDLTTLESQAKLTVKEDGRQVMSIVTPDETFTAVDLMSVIAALNQQGIGVALLPVNTVKPEAEPEP